MKKNFIWHNIGITFLIQSTLLYAPPTPKTQRTEYKPESTSVNKPNKPPRNIAAIAKQSQKQNHPNNFEQSPSSRTVPIEAQKTNGSGIAIPSQKPPQNPIQKTNQTRTFSQKTNDQMGNIFRKQDLYTTKNSQTGEKRIETRNKQGDIQSVRIEQPNGSYIVYDGIRPGRILEQKYTDGTIAKNFEYDTSNNLTQATIYKSGVFGTRLVGTRTYDPYNEKKYTTIEHGNNNNQQVEISNFDRKTNIQTIEIFTGENVPGSGLLSTEIITPNNRTFINEKSNKRIITTKNNEKVTVESDGSYTIESGNNRVKIELPDYAEITIDSTTEPGITRISFENDPQSTITIGKNSLNEASLLIIEKLNNQPIKMTTIEKDGTIYSVERDGSTQKETFNGKTEIETTMNNQGQKQSIITTANDQQITVTQKDFTLTINKSYDRGIFNTGLFASKPKTITINFSSYLQALRKAKTVQEQAKIIDNMTIKLTENRDLIKTTEYQAFKKNILEEIELNSYKNSKPTELFTTNWLSYFYKQIFSKYYELKTVEAKINESLKRVDDFSEKDLIF